MSRLSFVSEPLAPEPYSLNIWGLLGWVRRTVEGGLERSLPRCTLLALGCRLRRCNNSGSFWMHLPRGRAQLRERWYNVRMTSLLDDAIEVLRSLPENVQAAAARVIIDCVSNYEDQRLSA